MKTILLDTVLERSLLSLNLGEFLIIQEALAVVKLGQMPYIL